MNGLQQGLRLRAEGGTLTGLLWISLAVLGVHTQIGAWPNAL